MHKFVSILMTFVAISASSTLANAYSSVSELPRPARWVQVTDPKRLIGPEDTRVLDGMLEAHRVKTTNQISIVVVDRIEGMTPKQFATSLFNSWQIGEKGKDNGLLILMSIGDRRVEFETGYGLEGILPDVICKRIQMESMVPEFKREAYGRGLVAGLERTINVLEGLEVHHPPSETRETAVTHEFVDFGDDWSGEMQMLKWGALGYALFALLYVVIKLLSQMSVGNQPTAQLKYDFLVKRAFPLWAAILFPIPAVFLRVRDKRRLEEFRRTPQRCQTCGGSMRVLSDAQDDEYLSRGQKVEEMIKSVDHDVYVCDNDKNIQIFHARDVDTSYDDCPICRAVAFKLNEDRVVIPATTMSSGQGVKIYRCASCNHVEQKTYTIPRKGSSSSSSGRSGGGGYSGGGRSGGGGAGSSW